MAEPAPPPKLRLESFNNLTKSLSFNLYDVCYAQTDDERRAYLSYIDEEYNAEVLTGLLETVCEIIGANILNVARQDYEPEGASVTMLIAEEPVPAQGTHTEQRRMVGERTADCVVAHLDKSHLTVHTYPESHPDNGICTFRADIEVSTCGTITPLTALNHLVRYFDSDVLSMDYRVRGFTRDVDGHKHYIDHAITSIQNFIDRDLLDRYLAVDVNMYQKQVFHTDLMWKDVDLERYTFGGKETLDRLGEAEQVSIRDRLEVELSEIFYGRNLG